MYAKLLPLLALLLASMACTVGPTTSSINGQGSTTPVPSPPSSSAQTASKDPAGIFDGTGKFDANAYLSTAKSYGTPGMITERFGFSWKSYHSSISAPTWWQPQSKSYTDAVTSQQKFSYSRGIPCPKDDFSTSYAQVGYVMDSNAAGSVPGVDGISTLQRDHCLWAGQPQSYWAIGNGHPTLMLHPSGITAHSTYGTPQQPVEVTRAYGAGEAAGCSYMVFQDGQVACGEGGNTAQDYFFIKPFPANFTPTAASVTNNGEFLLVTGWNTDTYEGQLAVVAIGSTKPAGNFWGYEWAENYPGFRNYSLPVFAKLLGIINLPGMAAPTAVEAVGNWVYEPGAFLPVQAGQSSDQGLPGKFLLTNQANWQCFVSGACANIYDTAGFALVASRYERTVLVLDLGPLFQMISKGMFSSFSQFRANVANTGTKAGQWPPTFSEDPGAKPLVVKTMTFAHQVTAISASLYPDNLALIATEDGHIHVWNVDGLQTDTGNGQNAKEVHDLAGVGANITRIAHLKHWLHAQNHGGLVRAQYIALSRGDKTIRWIDLSSSTPVIIRTLQDSRLVDPISVEDNNNHGTQTDLIDVADYGDKNVKGYRYGPIIFWTTLGKPSYGMGPTGQDAFEYEGAYSTPTGPFTISIENVP